MTIILYTDASTKDGYSCAAYRSDHTEMKTFIYKTMNTAAMETAAIYYGLLDLMMFHPNEPMLVISDFLPIVRLINDPKQWNCKNQSKSIFLYHKFLLCTLLKNSQDIESVWVASKCPLTGHQDVDQASKKVLQEFLLTLK